MKLNQETLGYLEFLNCLRMLHPLQNGDGYFGLKS